MTKLEGIPDALASADLIDESVQLVLDEAIYPLEALYGAAYIFIDRCYVVIDRPEPGKYRATLAAKKPIGEASLRALVGEFANELLSCAWRHQITKENRASIEAITMQAIGGAMGPPSLDELANFDFSAQAFEDPLGIATSWEEKYKKKPVGSSEPSNGSGSGGDDTVKP
jgi:His-Xaa-Ser system protein HxsD